MGEQGRADQPERSDEAGQAGEPERPGEAEQAAEAEATGAAGRDLERELIEGHPELALLLRQTAQMLALRPSAVGEAVLRRLAGAVAMVLEGRLSPAETDALMAEVMAETQAWLAERRNIAGREGTREGYGR